MNYSHTAKTHLISKFVIPNDDVAHPLRECRTIAHCDRVGKSRFRMTGNCDHTHQSRSRAGIPSASTCSTFSPQREGSALLQRRTYRKENYEDYLIVSGRRTKSYGPYIPHDFLPCQANLTFDTDNQPNEEQHQRYRSPHPTRLTGSRRRGWL